MIGINFISFVILLVISVVVSAVLHFGVKYYARPGLNSFISKVIFGWIGARLGSPIFGHWFGGVKYEEVYIIPAILGCLSLLIIMVDLLKSVKATSAK
ncbi:hypothetical protein A2V82_10225 [candidate division KSB1 bacterium RBG_16_48_16]|nr:MAG: hypothetical protein A2V82_10225 [candidate division KSB1 bacterium RBG_16_48_16]